MASFIFKKKPSDTVNSLFDVEISRLGRGLPKRPQTTGAEQIVPRPGQPRNWPSGTDRKAPTLPGGR